MAYGFPFGILTAVRFPYGQHPPGFPSKMGWMGEWVRSRKSIVVVLQWLLVLIVAVVGATTEAGRSSPQVFWGLVSLASLGNVALMRIPLPYFYRPTQWMQLFIIDILFVGTAIYFVRGFDTDFYLPYFLILLTAAMSRSLASGVLLALGVSAAYLFLVWRASEPNYLLDTNLLLRIPLFFTVALFTSYLAHGARLQDEAREESQALADQVRSLQQLAAGIAHEVRNPLTALNNTLQALEGRLPAGDPARALVTDSLGQVGKVTRIVQETLDVARAAQLQVDWLEMNGLLERSLHTALGAVPEGRVTVERRFSPQASLVRGDGTLLEQVFTNILRNSAEAMPEGGTVRLETGTRLMRGREEVIVTLRDTGPGIPAHLAERLFQPFYTTKEDGTGLGLVLSRKYVRAHGGDLEVRAAAGGGTEVIIILPVAGPAPAVTTEA